MDLQRAARSLRGDRQAGLGELSELSDSADFGDAAQTGDAQPAQDGHNFTDAQQSDQRSPHPFVDEIRPMPAALAGAHGPIRDRAHAYRLLQDIADYLSKHEPHSPTPYLLRRAVAWGGMPLPDLLREVVQQEGDLSRYLAMLGLP